MGVACAACLGGGIGVLAFMGVRGRLVCVWAGLPVFTPLIWVALAASSAEKKAPQFIVFAVVFCAMWPVFCAFWVRGFVRALMQKPGG